MGVKTNVDGISIAPLKSALAYADDELGITVATSSYSEICQALSDYFPEYDGTLYNYGVQNVEWENPGSYTMAGTAQTASINSDNVYIAFGTSHTSRYYKVFGTKEKVDFTGFNYINFEVSLNEGTKQTFRYSVPSSGEYYVFIGIFAEGDNTNWGAIGYASSKAININTGTNLRWNRGDNSYRVYKVWLSET